MPQREKSPEILSILEKEEITLADAQRARELVYSQVNERHALDEMTGELQRALEAARSPEKRKNLSLRLGTGLWILRRYAEALPVLEGAPKSVLASYLRAFCLSRTGDHTRALKELDQTPASGAEAFEVDMAKAAILRSRGDVEAALKLIKQHENPADAKPALHVEKARCLEALGRYGEAMDELERARALAPGYVPALFRLAYACDLRGEEDKALEIYERCAELRPVHANTLINLGILYEDRGEHDRALACYRRVLETEPTHERAKLFLKDALASKTMYYDEEAEKRMDRTSRVLRSSISDFELSVRSRNCLKTMNIHTLGNLVGYTEEELLQFKNFGETSLAEIKRMLVSKGLRLGMKVDLGEGGPALPEPTGLPATEEEQVLMQPIEQLELSVRSRKCLVSLGIKTVGELIDRTPDELLACRNFGRTSLEEIREKLHQLGLSLLEVDHKPKK